MGSERTLCPKSAKRFSRPPAAYIPPAVDWSGHPDASGGSGCDLDDGDGLARADGIKIPMMSRDTIESDSPWCRSVIDVASSASGSR